MNLSEIREELSELVSGRVAVADGMVPPLVFVIAHEVWGVLAAAFLGVGSAVGITLWRIYRGKPVRFAVAGLGGVVVAAMLALRSGSADDFFVPGILSGGLTSLVIVVSIAVGRPFVAWTSWLARGWPVAWYWHPRVRPAYTRASWIWLLYFAGRTLLQWRLYEAGSTELLAGARLILGWPTLLVLLVVTYVLGRRWLTGLGGPSVAEFEGGDPPPWASQSRGF
ncbi:MAG TPA: DUF3159 domain-containing protein [Acidimicrobiia bacterium]|nr:DUF3159 domain-containing protein [Acidimicrobiia bacterium]